MNPLSLDANGLHFHALSWGEPAAPLVLLAHGFPDSPHSWAELGSALAAAGYYAVAPFLRGYAPTQCPAADTTLRNLGEDLNALGAALGRPTAHLIGHDWGAEAAYAAVGLEPTRWLSLTTIAIPHRATLRFTWSIAWGLRHVVALSLPGAEQRFAANDFAMIETFFRRWSPTWNYTTEDLAPVKACFRQPGSVHAALGYYRAATVLTPDFMARPVTVPALNIAGTDDPAVTLADYESTRRHYQAGLQLVGVPGGHFCHRESPARVEEVVLAHLRAHPGGS
ncbi:MAG TPA: alpha/beta hydrolase [Myxococcota bacterium]|nr:alpha/beta hydrolase [Myxococcota bacterium]